jgi:homoserine O-acetyltransferase
MRDCTAGLDPILLESGSHLPVAIAHRSFGHGPLRVLLLHALTGSAEAIDEDGKGWWAPMLLEGAPLGPSAAKVTCPNLPGSCYGSIGPKELSPFPDLTPRDQARALAAWIEASHLRFDLCLGGSLGGMVALELALLIPDRLGVVGVMGAGGRADAWIRAACHAQRRILESPLEDEVALSLVRQVAMAAFRSAESLEARFPAEGLEDWLDHHGRALASRFSRKSLHVLLGAMARFDLGRDRGGLSQALKGLNHSLHILGIRSDQLFVPALLQELADAAHRANRLGSLTWLESPHGHDAFLMEWEALEEWLTHRVLPTCRSRIAS